MKLKRALTIAAFLLIAICYPTNGTGREAGRLSPSTIIYKTKADYSKNVPVTLSKDKTKIISYPAPQDLYYQGKLAYPTVLKDGFLLDNRGINVNSAFIRMTYEDYSKLTSAPDINELYKMIIDKNPFKEMYDLGNRHQFKDEIAEINQLIEHHQLKKFKKIK